MPSSTAPRREAGRSERPRARHRRPARPLVPVPADAPVAIPTDEDETLVEAGGRTVRLTNLRKPYWSDPSTTKGDLLRYYASVAPWLVPHLRDRPMVMKRYPDGVAGSYFFMKRAPRDRPEWIETCRITHGSGNVIDFPLVQDTAALLWMVNLGCIDLNPWYVRCDDVDRPDFLELDLDPTPGTSFEAVREAALLVRDGLASLDVTCFAKTSGSRGIHLAVPIDRGPTQREVWHFAKLFSHALAGRHPAKLTVEYRRARRPRQHVLLDYNQNAWGRTLASVYSVRPRPLPTVSTPVLWDELERGVDPDAFRLDNVPARLRRVGDLWAPLLRERGRAHLPKL